MIARLLRIVLPALLAMVISMPAHAQAGDSFYNKGYKAMQTMTVASQNTAISYFTKAKAAYDSASQKSKCDQMITLCRNNIKTIQSGAGKTVKETPKVQQTDKPGKSGKSGRAQKETMPTRKTIDLQLSNSKLTLNDEQHTVTVNVTTNADSWDVAAVPTRTGSSFLSVSKSGNSVVITCPANRSSSLRMQTVEVTAEGVKRTVEVSQDGRPVQFTCDKSSVELGKKAGANKKINVVSNHDEPYEENNGFNWRVLSKPDWVEVMPETAKEGGLLQKGLSLVKEKIEGKQEEAVGIKSIVKIMTRSELPKGQVRNGDIVLQSGDKTIKIKVMQK